MKMPCNGSKPSPFVGTLTLKPHMRQKSRWKTTQNMENRYREAFLHFQTTETIQLNARDREPISQTTPRLPLRQRLKNMEKDDPVDLAERSNVHSKYHLNTMIVNQFNPYIFKRPPPELYTPLFHLVSFQSPQRRDVRKTVRASNSTTGTTNLSITTPESS